MVDKIAAAQTVSQTLERLGIDESNVNARTMRELVVLEIAIQGQVEKALDARRTLKGCSISKTRLADCSGLARATLYNNATVAAYHQARVEDEPLGAYEWRESKLVRALSKERKKVELMQVRDGQIELLKTKIVELESEIETLSANLERTNAEKEMALHGLRGGKPNHAIKAIRIHPKF